jgi:hypothetical protein
MVAFGDIDGTRVRELAWTLGGEGWKVSAFAKEQAVRHGWPRANYLRPQADVDGLLPAPGSEDMAYLTAGRPAALTDDGRTTPWITFAELVDLITHQESLGPVKSGQASSHFRIRADPLPR